MMIFAPWARGEQHLGRTDKDSQKKVCLTQNDSSWTCEYIADLNAAKHCRSWSFSH